jgi:hypothetical protein
MAAVGHAVSRCFRDISRALADLRHATVDNRVVQIPGAQWYFVARGCNDASQRGICGKLTAKIACAWDRWFNDKETADNLLDEVLQRMENGEDGSEYEGGSTQVVKCTYGRQMTPVEVWERFGMPLAIKPRYKPRGMKYGFKHKG